MLPLVFNKMPEALQNCWPRRHDLERWVHLLYDQALLVENSPLPDPNRLARNLTELMAGVLDKG